MIESALGSNHAGRGGAQVVFGDGRVVLLKNNIDINVLSLLGYAADKKGVGDNF